jgi:hypothetical protein
MALAGYPQMLIHETNGWGVQLSPAAQSPSA